MIYSTQHNKNTNEDPKTSVVFENLMLLPDIVFWSILKDAAANKGILPEDVGLLADVFYFWPKWNPNSKYDTGNSSYVEPDVFFRFERMDVIVEAKYSDNGGQYREEWDREFKAYLNEYEGDKKPVVLLAVGGNPTFEREPELRVGRFRCPIVKYSWTNMLLAVLDYEKKNLRVVEDDYQSSMKRIIRNLELGFQNIGIYRYNKKVELKGLSNLFTLGKIFQAAIARETDHYTLIYYKEDVNSLHYGYSFEVRPKDRRKNSIWLSIALWFNDQETIAITVRQDWAEKLWKLIEDKKSIVSKYADNAYLDEDMRYYFDATEEFYEEFCSAETFDAQVDLLAKLIDDVCMYYLNK